MSDVPPLGSPLVDELDGVQLLVKEVEGELDLAKRAAAEVLDDYILVDKERALCI